MAEVFGIFEIADLAEGALAGAGIGGLAGGEAAIGGLDALGAAEIAGAADVAATVTPDLAAGVEAGGLAGEFATPAVEVGDVVGVGETPMGAFAPATDVTSAATTAPIGTGTGGAVAPQSLEALQSAEISSEVGGGGVPDLTGSSSPWSGPSSIAPSDQLQQALNFKDFQTSQLETIGEPIDTGEGINTLERVSPTDTQLQKLDTLAGTGTTPTDAAVAPQNIEPASTRGIAGVTIENAPAGLDTQPVMGGLFQDRTAFLDPTLPNMGPDISSGVSGVEFGSEPLDPSLFSGDATVGSTDLSGFQGFETGGDPNFPRDFPTDFQGADFSQMPPDPTTIEGQTADFQSASTGWPVGTMDISAEDVGLADIPAVDDTSGLDLSQIQAPDQVTWPSGDPWGTPAVENFPAGADNPFGINDPVADMPRADPIGTRVMGDVAAVDTAGMPYSTYTPADQQIGAEILGEVSQNPAYLQDIYGPEASAAGTSIGPESGVYTGGRLPQSAVANALGNFNLGGMNINQIAALGGLAGVGLSSLFGNRLPASAQQLQGLASRAESTAFELQARALANQITPSQQAQLDQQRDQAIAALRQQFYAMGRNPDTDSSFAGAVANITAQLNAQKQQFIDAAMAEANALLGLSSQDLATIAAIAAKQNTDFVTALANALRGAGLLASAGSRTTTSAATGLAGT